MSRIWRRQHRQERQEGRCPGCAEHVAEVARRPHQHVLDRVGEDAAAFGDPVREHVEVLLQQDDVGGVLGDIGRRVHRDADVGRVQGQRVVDAVTEERDVDPGAALRTDDPRLLLGAHPREDRRRTYEGDQVVVVDASRASAPVTVPVTARPRSRQTFAATAALSPVTTFTEMPRAASRARAARRAVLGGVEEDEEAGQRQVLLVVGGERRDGSPRRGSPRRRRGSPRRTLAPSAVVAPVETSTHRARTASGAPLVICVVCPEGSRTTTDTSPSVVVERQHREPRWCGPRLGASRVAPGDDHSAMSRELPPTRQAVLAGPPRCRAGRGGGRSSESVPSAPSERMKVMRPSVRVPVLSVKSTSMSPRSSMQTSRLTRTLRRASSSRPGGQADVDTTPAAAAG